MMNRDRISRSRTGFGSSSSTTIFGLNERLERILLYVFSAVLAIFTPLGWLLALAVFFIEKNPNVRGHAVQAGVIFGVLSIVRWVIGLLGGLLSHIWLVGLFIGAAFSLIGWILFGIILALAVMLVIGASISPNYRLPYIGKMIDGAFAKWV
jgi:uncharacterized membrane protein